MKSNCCHIILDWSRINKTIKIDDAYSSSGTPQILAYDKLILTTGPWTNSLLGPEARNQNQILNEHESKVNECILLGDDPKSATSTHRCKQ